MKKILLFCICLLAVCSNQAQIASSVSIRNTDEVFAWIDRAKELQKKINRTENEIRELQTLSNRIIREKKIAQERYAKASAQLEALTREFNGQRADASRVRDSLNNLILDLLHELEDAKRWRKDLEKDNELLRSINGNQQQLLEVRAKEFLEVQRYVAEFSHLQFKSKDLWVRIEDNKTHAFASNKRKEMKVFAYHVASSFDSPKSSVPVRFRLFSQNGSNSILAIEHFFSIPKVENLPQITVDGKAGGAILQKFEGELYLAFDEQPFEGLKEGSYYYEILIDGTVEMRSELFQLERKVLRD